MNADADLCYRALASRDPRFDGRFFTGVRSTGIYCRPICPARTPLRRHVEFFACAAAAEAAGYRACKRCRPEAAPGTPAWNGTAATVARAQRLIEAGALDDGGNLASLAERVGVGERHLRRLFIEHLGAPPQAVAATRRLHLARELIETSDLTLTDIALAAGYASLRRFRAALGEHFGCSPSELRRRAQVAPAQAAKATAAGDIAGAPALRLTLRLGVREPLDWPALLAFLAARSIPDVEVVTDDSYRRAFTLGDAAGRLTVGRQRPGMLVVDVELDRAAPVADVSARLRRLFDLDADTDVIAAQLGRDPLLARALAARPSLRVPGAWDRFETLVRAVLGQQISVAAARTLAGRIAARWGRRVADGSPGLAFPDAATLAGADLESCGVLAARARTLRALAAAVATGELALEPGGDLDAVVTDLCARPGVGPWTAHYIALRALGEPDAFPASDLGLRRALADGDRLPTVAQVERRAEAWRPWRAYAATLLWGMDATSPGDANR